MRVSKKDKTIVLAISVALGLILVITAVVNILLMKAELFFEMDQLIFLGFIVSIMPLAAVNILDTRWRMSIDRNIPEFLRELSEAGRTGVTLTRALELASKRRYGPLSSELNRVVARLSWGGSLEEALKDFAERIDTRLAKRTSILISEINRSGGDIRDVLDVVSKHIRELQTIEEERMSQLKIYVAIVYVAFFIFLFIDYILVKTFFSSLEQLKEEMIQTHGSSLFLMQELNLKDIKGIMFHMLIMQGFFGGLVAGKMGEGAIGSGLKHCLVMMTIGFVIFVFFMA